MNLTTPTDGATDRATDGAVRIPFNRPSLQGREIEYIRAAVERGHTSAEGPFSARGRPAAGGGRGARHPPHHVVHGGAGDERTPARRGPG